MTYQSSVDWLFKQVPNYQHQGGSAYKPGFERVNQLLLLLDNPHKKLKTIHIAGTNGKGSVSHILSAVFQNHGYKVGLFTSPHIKDFTERIKINGIACNSNYVVDFISQFKVQIEQIGASFFEITTALAFHVFLIENCDIAIIETGLGGRLDSTNVLLPELSIITNIGFDHTAFLGNTLTAIATEKAGIIKKQVPVVIGDCEDDLREVFEEKANEMESDILFSKDVAQMPMETDLIGVYQQRNIHTALTALSFLSNKWKLKQERIHDALLKIQSLSGIQGRMQLLQEHPKIILDAAHNAAGIKNLLLEVGEMDYNELYILYGSSNDKDWEEIILSFPEKANLILTEFDSKRSVKKEEFEFFLKKTKKNIFVGNSVAESLSVCKSIAKNDDMILICGSFYLMEKII